MKNFYLITENSFDYYYLPYLWCSMKTYYEDNGLLKNEWIWHDPNLGERTDEEIFKYLELNPPDIFGLSVYVWNEVRFDKLATQIKKKYPKCLIIYGGPQQNVKHNIDYFRNKSWVDVTLPSDAYGEIVLTSILDNYPIENFENIPYIYYTDLHRNRYLSSKSIEKRSFKWPANIFKRQEKFIIEEIKKQKKSGRYIVSVYESSRGCPYKCIYCEWGGGINTKVIKKSYTDILSDIEWLSSVANVDQISFSDANFGMTSIDIEINKFLISCKNKYGYPINADYDFAKNNYKNVLKIKDLSIEAGLLDYITVALQTFNDEVRKNIERKDIPFFTQVEGINYLKSKYGDLPVLFEIILGLPGETVESYCEQIDIMFNHKIDIGGVKPVPWMLLPEAPAFDPVIREKFKIKTIKKQIDLNSKLKENRSKVFLNNLKKHWHNNSIETVISTYSYSEYDWLKMRRFKSFVWAGEYLGINRFLLKYLHNQYSIKPSEVYYSIEKLAYDYSFDCFNLNKYFENDYNQSLKWLNDPSEENITIDMGDSWDVILPQHEQILFIILTNTKDFFIGIGNFLSIKYNDPHILDLCIWIANILADYNLEQHNDRIFISKIDWQKYFHSNGKLFKKGSFKYLISSDILSNRYNLGNGLQDLEKDTYYVYYQNIQKFKKDQYVFKELKYIKD